MFAGIEFNSAAEALLAEKKERELEFRYEPRAGPEILPEPRLEVESLFDYDWEGEFDRSKSLLLTATDDIEKKTISFLERAEEYIKESCEDGKNIIFGKIRDEEKKEKIQSWLELIVETIHSKFKSKSLEHLDDINKYHTEILDHLITSAQNSISLHKSKLDEKVLISREAIALYQTSRDRYMKFAKSEAVRIAINETEDRVGAQMSELEEQVETSLHTQKLLIRQVDTLGSQVASKDQEINVLKSKIAEFEELARENAFNPFASSTTATTTTATLPTHKDSHIITDNIVESPTKDVNGENLHQRTSPLSNNKPTTKVTVGKVTMRDRSPNTVDVGIQTVPDANSSSNSNTIANSSPEPKTAPSSPGRAPSSPGRGDMKFIRGKGWQSSAPSPERENSASFDIEESSVNLDCRECEKLKLEIQSLGLLLSAQQRAISNPNPNSSIPVATSSTPVTTTAVEENGEIVEAVHEMQPTVEIEEEIKQEIKVKAIVVEVEEKVENMEDEVFVEEPSIVSLPALSIEGTDDGSIPALSIEGTDDGSSVIVDNSTELKNDDVSEAPIDVGFSSDSIVEAIPTGVAGMVYSDDASAPIEVEVNVEVEVEVEPIVEGNSNADTSIAVVSNTVDQPNKITIGVEETKEVSHLEERITNELQVIPQTEPTVVPKLVHASTIDIVPINEPLAKVTDLMTTESDVLEKIETKSSPEEVPEVNITANVEDNISVVSVASEDSMRMVPTKDNELLVLDADHGSTLLLQQEEVLNTSINLDTGSLIDGDQSIEVDMLRKMTESPPSGDIQSQYMNAINESNMSMYNNIRKADYENYVRTVAAMQDQNSRLATNVKALEAKLEKERMVTSLKLKERSMLLKELVSQVNDLRAELATARLAHVQTQKSTVHIKVPRAASPTRPPTVMARLDSGYSNQYKPQSNQQQTMTPITSGLSPIRPGSSSSNTKKQYGIDGMNTEAAERPFTTSASLPYLRSSTFSASGGQYGGVVNPLPLSNSFDAAINNGVTPGSKPSSRPNSKQGSKSTSKPNSADNKNKSKSKPNIIKNPLSTNKIGSGGLSGLPPRVKTPLRLPRTMQSLSVEEGQLDLNWLGAEQETHDEITQIREKLLQHLAEISAKDALKKEIRLATTANKDLKQAGREIRLKEWKDKQAALYAIGKKVIDKHKPKKQKEYW